VPGGSAPVYEIDLSDGAIVPMDAPGLACPAVNPGRPSLAWVHPAENADQMIVTNPDGSNPVLLAEHTSIYDPIWSPDGDILIYTAIDEDQTFRPLYSHQDAVTRFWPRDAGLVIDYVWLPDSSALLLAYYTQENAVIGRLARDCITTTAACAPMPLATFDINSGLILTEAFSPDGTQAIVIEEQSSTRADLRSELFRIDLENGGKTPLTNLPNVIKTSVIWLDGIYFVGGRFDASTLTFSASAIYRLDVESNTVEIAYQAEGYFPVQIIWAEPSS
jgi:Tol biopolymer transport system component